MFRWLRAARWPLVADLCFKLKRYNDLYSIPFRLKVVVCLAYLRGRNTMRCISMPFILLPKQIRLVSVETLV